MTKEQNVRAILETVFSQSKDELIDIAVKNIMALNPQEPNGHWKYTHALYRPWTCSKCGYENEEETDFCPGCGLDMREEDSQLPRTFRCVACIYPVVRLRLLHFSGVTSVVMHHRVVDNTLYRQDMLICNCIRYSVCKPHGLHIPMPYSKRGCLSIFYAVASLITATSYILANVQKSAFGEQHT